MIVSLQFWAPVGGTADTQGGGLAGHVITIAGGGNGVQANVVWLAVLWVGSGRNNTVGLALPVWDLALVVHDDVAGLASCLGTNNTLHAGDLGGARALVFVGVHWNGALVVV